MNSIAEKVERLISLDKLKEMSGEEIIDCISLRIYEADCSEILNERLFSTIPLILRDIILVINFDTELSMNGILGFLENSSGLYLDDTIDMLKRINAIEDYKILIEIKRTMTKNGYSIENLHNSDNRISLFGITSFIGNHGQKVSIMASEIVKEAQKLYIYNERNIYDNLVEYLADKKEVLIDEVENLRGYHPW